jgi:hypothetical protein
LGPDITPLHVIVRYRHREREGPHKCPLWTPFIYSVNSELLVRSSQVTFLRKKLVHKILLLCFGKFWYDFHGALNSLNLKFFCTFLRRRQRPILLDGFVALVNQKLGSDNVHSCRFTDWCCAQVHSWNF